MYVAEAAKDLKTAGYTELQILATLEAFKRSGKLVLGSPPWTPKLPINLSDTAKDLEHAGYSTNQVASIIEEFKQCGLPYVAVALLPGLSRHLLDIS